MGKQPVMDLQRLSEEVARDPASPAFLPLAQSYRRQGRYDAAIQLCIRALARNPSHLEGHVLLAQLYLESGDQERAGDEWSIVLRLDPDHFEAHRGLGFYWLDRGRREEARAHLERAAALRPDDTVVQGALSLLADGGGEAPGQVFAPILQGPACLGVLLQDPQGLVLAGGGKGEGGGGDIEMLAALLGGALTDAAKLLDVARGGEFRGLTLVLGEAVVELVSLAGSHSLLVVAAPDTPAGWLDRLVARATELGRELLGGGS